MSDDLTYFDSDEDAERSLKTVISAALREYKSLDVLPSPRGEIRVRYKTRRPGAPLTSPARVVAYTTFKMVTEHE